MIRPITCICMLMAAASGLYLYQTKHRTRMLDKTIEQTLAATEVVRERTRLLSAEWALLNDPGRLGELAGKFLTLRPVSPGQFTTLAELDRRLPPTRAYPPAGALPPPAPPLAPPQPPPEIPLAQIAPEPVLPRPAEKPAARIALAQAAPVPSHAATPAATGAPVMTPPAPPAHPTVPAPQATLAATLPPVSKPMPHPPAPTATPLTPAETKPEIATALPAAKPPAHPAIHPPAVAQAGVTLAERHDSAVEHTPTEHAPIERRQTVASGLPAIRPGISALAGPMATPVANPVMMNPVVSRVMATSAQPRPETGYTTANQAVARGDRFSAYTPRVTSSLGSARSLLAPPVPVSAAETVAAPGAR
jgi:hypothetical protein